MPSYHTELEYLYQASGSAIGIVLSVSDFDKARQRLYLARKAAGDPTLDTLQFRRSPAEPDTELWIVKGGQIGTPRSDPPTPTKDSP